MRVFGISFAVLLCISMMSCGEEGEAPATGPVYTQDFSSSSDFAITNTSQTSGMSSGNFSGTISGGVLSLSANALLTGMPGAGLSGSGKATLSANAPILEANKNYVLTMSYKTDVGGWVVLSRSVSINGTVYPLDVTTTYASKSITFTSGSSAAALDLFFMVAGGDDMGAAPSAELWVDAFSVTAQ